MDYKDKADKPVSLQGTIATYTGKWVSFKTLTPEDVDIRDIAHSLAMTCRFRGHTPNFYSVAEHCVRIYDIVASQYINTGPGELALAALLHDAAEAYMCDLPAPFKQQFKGFKAWEWEVEDVIRRTFGIAVRFNHEAIKQMDYEMLLMEFATLFPPHLWPYPDIERAKWHRREWRPGWHPETAEEAFLERFAKHREVPNEQYATTA